MHMKFSERQLADLSFYKEYGWPHSLTMGQLVLFEQKDKRTIQAEYLNRADAPVKKNESGSGITVPLEDWIAFKSAVVKGMTYTGLGGQKWQCYQV